MRTLVALALLLIVVGAIPAQDRPSQPPDCGVETARTKSDLLKAEQFFKQLRAAVEREDRNAVASMTNFPLRVNGKLSVTNSAAFLRNYDKIFDQQVRTAIHNQRVDCIFGNWQGFMAGNGDVWFEYSEPDPRFHVTAVNNKRQASGAK